MLKSGELLSAVTSSPPWAHAPGLPHEFRIQKKNLQRDGLRPYLGEQRIVLLMRAIVSRPPVVLIHEVWVGMDEGMIFCVPRYLTEGDGAGEGQAAVVITHWEEDVPWVGEEVRLGRVRMVLLDERVVLLVWGVGLNPTHIMPILPTFRPLHCSCCFQHPILCGLAHITTTSPAFLPTNTKILICGKFWCSHSMVANKARRKRNVLLGLFPC